MIYLLIEFLDFQLLLYADECETRNFIDPPTILKVLILWDSDTMRESPQYRRLSKVKGFNK